MITVRNLTKRYGQARVVDDLTFEVQGGAVTGFLGPNGAGKSTTMRLILTLTEPTAGVALVNGQAYRDLRWPLREVGAVLDAKAFHPSRTARQHLHALAASSAIPLRRADDMLQLVGLEKVARHRVGTFSLGMSQRLGLACALLGDPPTLLLDEPLTGLDPEGVRWARDLLRCQAGQGRTVFVSSHLLSEMSLTAVRLIVIGAGRLLVDTTVDEFLRRHSQPEVLVRTDHPVAFAAVLAANGGHIRPQPDTSLIVAGLDARQIGALALAHAVPLNELTPHHATLEDAFLQETHTSSEFRTQPGPTDTAASRQQGMT